MRKLLLVLSVTAGLALGASAAFASDEPQRTIPCEEIIESTRFPDVGSSKPGYRLRTVLGAVSVPPAYVEQVFETRSRPWTYFSKHGLVARADGRPVTITVPRAWRTRAGIVWGNAGHRVFHTIRLAGCGSEPARGNAYAGGFFLRRPSACVPLVFRVGSVSRTVWFGLGERCPVRS